MSPLESHKPVFQLSRSAVVRLEQNTRQVERVAHMAAQMGRPSGDALEKALEDAEQGRWQAFHSKRGARLMAYLLLDLESVTKTPEYLNQLSFVLERYKTKSMESALLMATMAHWSESHRPRLQRLVKQHVTEKVKPMGVQSLRPYLVDDRGVANLGQWLGGLPVHQWSEQIQSMGFTPGSGGQGFFFEVFKGAALEKVARLTGPADYEEGRALLDWLGKESSPSAQLLAASRMVMRADKRHWDTDLLRDMVLEVAGDVGGNRWRERNGLTHEEVQVIVRAEAIVDGWLSMLFLERFWDVVEDERRRAFWQGKIKRLRNVRLVLDDQLYDKVYDNITEAMKPRIYRCRVGGVLIFEFMDSMFVEFGGQAGGALQVIPPHDERFISARERLERYRSDKLKGRMAYQRFDLQNLKRYGMYEVIHRSGHVQGRYGKFNHAGYWEQSLNEWMRKYDRG